MLKISVIVPVYNTEKYVEKCIKSILNQTMQDIEIIIVNDGSKDNSENIIEKCIKENKTKIEIKYVKKENGGLSSARNFGLQYAKGKYISFIDSDDYIDKNLYKNLEKYIDEDIDLIKFKMQIVDNNEKVIEKLSGPIFEKCTGEQGYKKICTKEKFLDPACIYLYKRKFFIENKFKYVGRYHEDFGLTSLIIVKAKSFVSTDEYGYYYLQTNESLTRTKNYEKEVERAKYILMHYDNMINIIQNYEINQETKDLVKRYYTNSVLLKAKELKEKELDNYIKEIKIRKMYKNIKPYNLKQFLKRIILKINVKLYINERKKNA